jgi:hypothetical protein
MEGQKMALQNRLEQVKRLQLFPHPTLFSAVMELDILCTMNGRNEDFTGMERATRRKQVP